MIYIIDDDKMMADCIVREVAAVYDDEVRVFTNGVEAISALDNGVPELIFLDILLDGPDGFTFLNEISSYSDTEQIPVVVVSSLNLADAELSDYGVVKVLDKSMMVPADIKKCVEKYIDERRS
ncbi:response regulator [Candidatus Saccharibacteria bacterium]|nr:response regulator [Candidatus Saccharibacteria bacterium]